MWHALAALAGNVAGGIFSAKQQDNYNKKAFDREMAASNTAHQREAADLRAAGYNPILTVSGSGASVPHAAAANAPDFSGIGSTAIANTAKMQDIVASKASTDKVIQDTDLSRASTAKTEADADIARSQAKLWRDNPELMAGSSYARDAVAAFSTAKRAGKSANENVIKFGKKWGSPVPETGSWKSKFLNFLFK